MLQNFTAVNDLLNGKPAGGRVECIGLSIRWQNGPLGRGHDRLKPNGAFVETVIQAALQRIEFYEEAGFECSENKEAIKYLQGALNILDLRTKARESEGVEGTHERRAPAEASPLDPDVPERVL